MKEVFKNAIYSKIRKSSTQASTQLRLAAEKKQLKSAVRMYYLFYTFDAPIENAPKVGIEITDFGMEHEPECVKKYYEGCETVVDIAKKQLPWRALISFASVWKAGTRTEQTNLLRNW